MDSGALRPGELVPAGEGTWGGRVFGNPLLGLRTALTFGFCFPYGEVVRDGRTSAVSLTVDWVELAVPSWRDLAGRQVRVRWFGEPAEAVVRFFGDHQYQTVDLRVAEQHGERIRVAVTVSGDLQGLGLPALTADRWLTFTGIEVADADAARLADFTDGTGLIRTAGTTPGRSRYSPGRP